MNKQRHRMAVAAHLILRNKSGEVLFLRRANTGYADGQWSIPAGHVEQGETLASACCREVAEEIGIELDISNVNCVLVQHKHDLDGEERIDVFFSAALPQGQSPEIREPDSCDALHWANSSDPPEPTVAYVAHAISAISRPDHPIVAYFGF
jgi:8-oxo-dGTP diphosphatase